MKLPERTKTELCKKLAEEPIPMDGIVEVYPSGINTRYGILECSEKWLYAGEIITPKCMKGQGVLFLNDRNVKYEG